MQTYPPWRRSWLFSAPPYPPTISTARVHCVEWGNAAVHTTSPLPHSLACPSCRLYHNLTNKKYRNVYVGWKITTEIKNLLSKRGIERKCWTEPWGTPTQCVKPRQIWIHPHQNLPSTPQHAASRASVSSSGYMLWIRNEPPSSSIPAATLKPTWREWRLEPWNSMNTNIGQAEQKYGTDGLIALYVRARNMDHT